jgi:hypothetical protein
MNKWIKYISVPALGLAFLCCTAATEDSGCNPQADSEYAAQKQAWNHQAYVPQHDLEFDNYNRRQKMTDDPTQIIWCTAYFTNPSAKPITFPIKGKLTSGSKRPFPDDPGPDGMYGPSGDYRYGFTPGGNYVDFYGVETICTNALMIWQKQTTLVATDEKAE